MSNRVAAPTPLRPAAVLACSSVAALIACTSTAAAQTELPGIVVTSPSPVAKSKPARPAQSQPGEPSSAPAPTAADPSPTSAAQLAATAPSAQSSGPIGTLIVIDDAFVPVTVATDREILATQGATLTDTLATKSGVTGSTFAPGANRPIIRGLDSYRVRVQENGIGSHDVSALSEDHAVPIDPFAAERVEVIRGPATLRYGSQAIGGVVSVENSRIPAFSPPRGFSGEIRGGLSSVDDGREGAFKATAGAAGIVVTADGFKRNASDYQTPKGRQLNSFVDSEGYSAGAAYVWSTGFVGASYARITSLYGIPGAEAEEARPRIDLLQEKVQAKGEWRVRNAGIEAIRFWLGATDYRHNEVVSEEDVDELGDPIGRRDIIGTRFTNREREGRLEIQHLPIMTGLGELTGAVGLQVGRRRTSGVAVDEPVDGLLDPATTRTLAAFWFEELQLTRNLRLQAAARIEDSRSDGRGLADFSDPAAPVTFEGERKYRPVSASLGALYQLPLGVIARLTGQYVERAPDAAELFSKGVHEATGTFEIGNPNLALEKARSLELGFKRAAGALRFDSSVHYARYDGFIFRQLTGVRCGDTLDTCGAQDELDQVVFQQRAATFYGAEITAQYDVAPIWRGVWGIEGQYDFVRARFEGDNVPRIPPHRIGGGLFYRDANWLARAGVLHAFEQTKVNIESGELTTPGYTLVSAELSYTTRLDSPRLDGSGTRMTIGVKGENLADDDVLNHASFKRREEVYLPGASVKVFGSIKFD